MQRQREADKWRGFRLPELFAPIGHLCGDDKCSTESLSLTFFMLLMSAVFSDGWSQDHPRFLALVHDYQIGYPHGGSILAEIIQSTGTPESKKVVATAVGNDFGISPKDVGGGGRCKAESRRRVPFQVPRA